MAYRSLVVIFTLTVVPCTFRSVVQAEKVSLNFKQDALDNLNFPKNFLFGVAVSSPRYGSQWNTSDKEESVGDYMTHATTVLIQAPSNVDTASDFYYKYKEDIRLARSIGTKIFQFSLSWPNILPEGYTNHVNEDSVQFYKNVIDEIVANGMMPMIVLFHWDLPNNLQKMGGLTNPLFVDWFEQYARFVFKTFGNKVKYWITIVEANMICYGGYGGYFAPFINVTGFSEYLCGHHILLAHAKVYRLYQREFRPDQKGKIGYSIVFQPGHPEDPSSSSDVTAVENDYQWFMNWLLHPVFSSVGDYLPAMKERITSRSRSQGFFSSRLPSFTKEQIRDVRGASDFLGINYLTYEIITSVPSDDIATVSFDSDNYNTISPELGLQLKDAPSTFGKLIQRLHKDYHPTIYITANGFPDKALKDTSKVNYLRGHLEEISKAIRNGIDIQAYVQWSLVDNLELQTDSTIPVERKFGLFHVDFSSSNFTRTPRLSAEFISRVYTRTAAG